MIEVTLSSPIETPKGRLEKITLRPATLRTLKRAGGSYLLTFVGRDDEGRAVIRTDYDPHRLAATIVELSPEVDEISVDDLTAGDVARIGNLLAPSFAGI